MSPIEIAARAAWNDCFGPEYPWENAPQMRRDEAMDNMRAALLALAEAELPERFYEGSASVLMFRAMLRSLAEEKP